VVSRNTIEDEIAYDDFEDNIALLVYYRDFLPSPQQRQLDAIVTLWDRQEAAFLTQEQVQFVMRAPRATYVAHQRAIDRYPYLRRSLERDFERSVDSAIAAAHKLRHSVEQAARQEERRLRTSTRHSLHTLYEEESEYRAQHRRISVFDETRPQRAILRRNIRRALATLEGAVSMEQIAVAAGLSRPTLYAYDIYRLGEREIRRRAAREVARPQLIMPREREMDPEPAVRNALMMLEGTQTQRHIAEVAGIHWGTFSGEQYEQFVREENERRVAAESPMQPIVLRSEEIQNADQRVVDVLRAWPEDTPVTEAGIARELHMSRNTVRPLLRAAFDAVNQERAAQEKPPLAIYKRRTTDTRAAVEEGLKKLPGGTVTMEAIADASGVSRATLFLEKNRPMVDELMAVDNVRRTAAGIQTIQLSYTWTRPDDIRAGLRTLEGPVYISQVLSAIGVQDRGILERVDIHAFIAEENTRRSKEEPDRAPISIRKEPEVAIRDALVDFDGEEIGLAQLSRAADVSISTLYNYDVRAIAASAGRLRRKKGKNPVRITPYARATKKTPQIRHALKDISGEVTLEQIAAAADVDPHTLYANDVFGLVEDVNASREGSDTQPITIVHARWGTPLNPPSRGQTDGSA
jgi:AraC-like DNA-binding protein